MGRHRFHGSVETLADACEADYLVVVMCERCEVRKRMHPYNLLEKRRHLDSAKLDTLLPGFYCTMCRSKVQVKITCTHQHPGEL